jgi:myo-inositol-1(or 4)-monophosphatase
MQHMHPMLNIAVKAARRAGNLIHRSADKVDHLTITKKSHADFVSEVDRAAEQTIIQTLLDAYPDHAILAEESGAHGESDFVWIIDPLDGTTNFLHGFPQYSVSIALQHKGIVTQAVIYDPTKNELFTATRGRGALGILEEQLVKITHPVEQQSVRMLRLDAQELLNHRCVIFGNRLAAGNLLCLLFSHYLSLAF